MLDLNYKDVAEKYGGNKQKIAEAAAIGALGPEGPLLAVAAGMYIDRMRAAQVAEQAPQQTVAQQVLAPQPTMSPQGLAAAQPPSPSMPPAATPAPMAAPAPMPAPEQAPVGMAEGGYLPPYASGGLSDLPLPDTMFDEPDNGGYAGGGLVAFAAGDAVEKDQDTYYGYNYRDPLANEAILDRLYGKPQTKYEEEIEQSLLRQRSPEYMKTQKRKDMGQLMAEAGLGLMSAQGGNFLQNLSAAVAPALGRAAERKRERRAEEREIQKGLLDLEQGKNTRAAQRATRLMEAQGIAIKGREEEVARKFRAEEEEKQRAYDWKKFLANERGENYRAGLRARAEGSPEPKVNVSVDDVVIKSPVRSRPDTVIPRMRVTQRGSSNYWYEFPSIIDPRTNAPAAINPAQGAYGIGIQNALRYSQAKNLGLGVSPTGRLQYVRNGKLVTIPDEKIRKFNEAGEKFNPNTYKY